MFSNSPREFRSQTENITFRVVRVVIVVYDDATGASSVVEFNILLMNRVA